ncbi:transposase [Escherichia coli]|nr:transposase [Escherichia coli]
MQTRDNLDRMVVIAVRVLGLRQGGVREETQTDTGWKRRTPTEGTPTWGKRAR